MKGQAEVILAFLLTIVMAWIMLTSLNVIWDSGFTINRKINIQQDLYAMENALDGAKLYMETALQYSTYQALFDYGKEEKSDDNTGKLSAAVSEKTGQNLNRYTTDSYTFLSQNYKVALPKYEVVAVFNNNTLNIVSTSSNNFVINRVNINEKATLEKNARLEFNFVYPPLQYIDILSSDGLNKIITDFINKTWNVTAAKTLEGCENRNKEAEDIEVFNEMSKQSFKDWAEADKHFLNSIESEIMGLQSTLSKNNITVNLKLQNQTGHIDHLCKFTKDDKCDQAQKTYSYAKTCTFGYSQTSNIKIQINDGGKQYPVKVSEDGSEKILFKPLSFISTNNLNVKYP